MRRAHTQPARWRGGRRRLWLRLVLLGSALTVALGGCRGEAAPATGPAFGTAVPVRSARVEIGDLAIHADYPGELVGEAVELAPRVSGRLAEVRVRIGDNVARGQVLAVVEAIELSRQLDEAGGQLGVARAQVSGAQAQLAEAEASFERSAELYQQRVLSSQEYDRLQARLASARAELRSAEAQVEQSNARVERLAQQLADTEVVAPFAGAIAARYLDPGAVVQPGTPVLRVVERGSLIVQFRVPERDLGRLGEGHPLSVTTQATGTTSYSGHVVRISGEVARSDRTVLVEGVLDAADEVLRPGMYASVRVRLDDLRGVKIVPGLALVQRLRPDGLEEFGVFGVDAEQRAVWWPIEVKGRAEHLAAIDSEIAANQVVLTLGHEELAPGSAVRIVEGPGAG